MQITSFLASFVQLNYDLATDYDFKGWNFEKNKLGENLS